MKQIKFRQFINGNWHYWGFIRNTFTGPANLVDESYQYVGMEDCAHVPIYEGDIVSFDGYYSGDTYYQAGKGIVTLEAGSWCIMSKVPRTSTTQLHTDFVYEFNLTEGEISYNSVLIIGDFKQNPELLDPPKPIKDVHTEHCCILHGCKYGDWNNDSCTVMHNKAKQSFICEECATSGITSLDEVKLVLAGKLKVCGYCNKVVR